MSATVQSVPPRSRSAFVPFLVAILVALAIGAVGGSIATRTALERTHPVATATGWDAQKLAAMRGRQLAAASQGGVRPWDPGKLAAMAGRQEAEAIRLNGPRR